MRGRRKHDAPGWGPEAAGGGGDSYQPYDISIIAANSCAVKFDSSTEGITSHVLPNLARQVAVHIVYRLQKWLYYAWRAANGRLMAMLGSPQ